MFTLIVPASLNIPLLKADDKKLISNTLANKNEEKLSFFTIVISFKLKICQHNADTASYNLFQCSRNLTIKLASNFRIIPKKSFDKERYGGLNLYFCIRYTI